MKFLYSLVFALTFCLSTAFAQNESSADGQVGLRAGKDAAPTSYIIRPLDTISFGIVGEGETDMQDRVDQDGFVAFPYLQKPVKVAGLTVKQARDHLFELYTIDVYVNPQIQLIVIDYADLQVFVQGQVLRQGIVPLPPEEPLYLLGAISASGGWGAIANKRKVELHRQKPDGKTDVTVINANNIGPKDYKLQDGDLIYVPETVF